MLVGTFAILVNGYGATPLIGIFSWACNFLSKSPLMPLFDEGSLLPPYHRMWNKILQDHIGATQLLDLNQIVRHLFANHFSHFQLMFNDKKNTDIKEISISFANSFYVHQQSSLKNASTWLAWVQSMALTGQSYLLCC